MAVSNVSSSSSSSIYGSRSSNIISGLASGLDTESMIEGMVSGIKSKIDTQKQNQQILLWQQEAFRSISDQLVQLSSKYTSYTSSTNLMSAAFFQPSIITSLGKYADMISASGSTSFSSGARPTFLKAKLARLAMQSARSRIQVMLNSTCLELSTCHRGKQLIFGDCCLVLLFGMVWMPQQHQWR